METARCVYNHGLAIVKKLHVTYHLAFLGNNIYFLLILTNLKLKTREQK